MEVSLLFPREVRARWRRYQVSEIGSVGTDGESSPIMHNIDYNMHISL